MAADLFAGYMRQQEEEEKEREMREKLEEKEKAKKEAEEERARKRAEARAEKEKVWEQRRKIKQSYERRRKRLLGLADDGDPEQNLSGTSVEDTPAKEAVGSPAGSERNGKGISVDISDLREPQGGTPFAPESGSSKNNRDGGQVKDAPPSPPAITAGAASAVSLSRLPFRLYPAHLLSGSLPESIAGITWWRSRIVWTSTMNSRNEMAATHAPLLSSPRCSALPLSKCLVPSLAEPLPE